MTPKCPDCKHDQDDCSCSETIESLRQQLSDNIKRDVMLRSFMQTIIDEARETEPLVAERFIERAEEIAEEALAATADLSGVIPCHAEPCRDDGRCQYAIDHGSEGLGHCPDGKCCMPLYRAWEPK